MSRKLLPVYRPDTIPGAPTAQVDINSHTTARNTRTKLDLQKVAETKEDRGKNRRKRKRNRERAKGVNTKAKTHGREKYKHHRK